MQMVIVLVVSACMAILLTVALVSLQRRTKDVSNGGPVIPKDNAKKQLVRILAIDGGGIRGIIPAVLLAELEERAERPVSAMFDVIAGTSTGGLLALGLTKPTSNNCGPQYTAADLLKLYCSHAPELFSTNVLAAGGMLGPRYDSEQFTRVIERLFGKTRIKEALTEVLITSYNLLDRSPYYFTRKEAAKHARRNVLMSAAACATCAAPMYFEPVEFNIDRPMAAIDGGVFANNPAMLAFAEAQRLFGPDNDFVLVSIGTGSAANPIPVHQARRYGYVGWAQCLLDIVNDGVTDVVHRELELLLPTIGRTERYYRFQLSLPPAQAPMDCVNEANIMILTALAREYVETRPVKQHLERLCDQLLGVKEIADVIHA